MTITPRFEMLSWAALCAVAICGLVVVVSLDSWLWLVEAAFAVWGAYQVDEAARR